MAYQGTLASLNGAATGQEIGDILFTARTLTAPTYLPAAGGTYLRSAYPTLGNYFPSFTEVSDPVTRIPDPSVLPPGSPVGVSFSPNSLYLAVTHNPAPYITMYKRFGDVFNKLPNDTITVPGGGRAVKFSNDSAYLAVGHNTSPFLSVFKREGDTFTKLADPTILPTGSIEAIAWSSDGTYLAVGASGGLPTLRLYKRDGDTLTALNRPASEPGYNIGVLSLAFTPNDQSLFVGSNDANSNGLRQYNRAGDVFTQQTTIGTGICSGISISPDGATMIISRATFSPTVYPITYTTNPGAVVGSATTGPSLGASTQQCAISNDGRYVAFCTNSGSTLCRLNGTTLTVVNPQPSPVLANAARAVDMVFGPNQYMDNFLVVAGSATPFIAIYRDGYSFDPTAEFKVPDYSSVEKAGTKAYIKAS